MSQVLSIVVDNLFKQAELVDAVGHVVAFAEMIHRCQDSLTCRCSHDELVELGHVEIP